MAGHEADGNPGEIPARRRHPPCPEAREVIEGWRIDYNTERPHRSLKYQPPEEFAAARPFDKMQGAQPLELIDGPRLRPLLTPPNDGTQKENKLYLYLRVALKTGAGHWNWITKRLNAACAPSRWGGKTLSSSAPRQAKAAAIACTLIETA